MEPKHVYCAASPLLYAGVALTPRRVWITMLPAAGNAPILHRATRIPLVQPHRRYPMFGQAIALALRVPTPFRTPTLAAISFARARNLATTHLAEFSALLKFTLQGRHWPLVEVTATGIAAFLAGAGLADGAGVADSLAAQLAGHFGYRPQTPSQATAYALAHVARAQALPHLYPAHQRRVASALPLLEPAVFVARSPIRH